MKKIEHFWLWTRNESFYGASTNEKEGEKRLVSCKLKVMSTSTLRCK